MILQLQLELWCANSSVWSSEICALTMDWVKHGVSLTLEKKQSTVKRPKSPYSGYSTRLSTWAKTSSVWIIFIVVGKVSVNWDDSTSNFHDHEDFIHAHTHEHAGGKYLAKRAVRALKNGSQYSKNEWFCNYGSKYEVPYHPYGL